MDLVKVDVLGTESLQRGVDRCEQVLARQPPIVGTRAGRVEDLGRQHVVLAARKQPGQQAPRDDLARAVGIHVGRVKERHTDFDCAAHDRLRLILL